jgi:uncharacterized integral membrane protein
MFILGLLLIVLGILAILGAVTTDSTSAAFFGFDDLSALAIFFIGLGSGVAILWGFTILRFGTRRTLKHRREQKKLHDLSEQLERADYERHRGDDEDRPEHDHQ